MTDKTKADVETKKGTTLFYDRLQNIEAITQFNGKALITSQDYLDLKAYEHAIAFTVAKIADQDMLVEVHKAMKQAIESGMTFHEFKKRLKPYLMAKGWLAPEEGKSEALLRPDARQGLRPRSKNDNVDDDKETFKAYNKHLGHRLKTIYHTNKQSAYAAGQWQRIQKTKDFLPYLQYMPSLSERQRDEHRRYYNLVRPVDDPIWQYIMPPNGFGCQCWVKQLTKRQAQKIGVMSDDDSKAPIEWVDYKNPKTGEVSQVPKGITPSFSHNHDRLTAMLRLAKEKHGSVFGEQLKAQLTDNMLELALKTGAVSVVDFTGIVARQAEIERLMAEGVRRSEAELTDQWQQYYQVKIVGFEQGVHKMLNPPNPPDLAQVDDVLPKDEWLTLDIMYTLEKHANPTAFNRDFHKSDKSWEKARKNIIKHIQKADIVPMYLDHMDSRTAVKIIGFVLSLSKEQQQKVVFVWGNKP